MDKEQQQFHPPANDKHEWKYFEHLRRKFREYSPECQDLGYDTRSNNEVFLYPLFIRISLLLFGVMVFTWSGAHRIDVIITSC